MEEVIVVSLRKGAPPIPKGYVPVRIDRKSPLLGNPFFLDDKNDRAGRDRVIDNFRDYLRGEMREKSPVWQEVIKLADRVQRGEKLALQCWCSPKPCHGDIIKKAIYGILRKRGYVFEGQQSLSL